MHIHRFYIPQQNISDKTIIISQPEYHHIIDVLRFNEGDNIVIFDGKGNEYSGKINSINRKDKTVNVQIENVFKEKNKRPLILVQSLIKSVNMDLIFQKATEIGVTHIYPLISANSVVKIDSKTQNAKLEKWRRITEEASKQCGRNWIPFIDKIWDIEEIVQVLNPIDCKLICAPRGHSKSLKNIPDNLSNSVAVMVGPEGDFTDKEIAFICDNGWTPIHLGKTILRAETAVIAVLGALSYKFGYWK